MRNGKSSIGRALSEMIEVWVQIPLLFLFCFSYIFSRKETATMKISKWNMISVCCAIGSAIFEILKATAAARSEDEKLDQKIRSVMQEETRESNEKG